MRRLFMFAVGFTAAFLIVSQTQAKVKLPKIFGDNMVLQRDMPVTVWGWADPGEAVAVSFAGQEKKAVADDEGKWSLKLAPMKAESKGTSMTIAGQNKVVFNNVVVGEVWICSGQSNMAFPVGGTLNAKEEIANAKYPEIRHIKFPNVHSTTPLDDFSTKGWELCGPKTVGSFTAVGYFFARTLFKELDVPIGLIGTNWGGTRIEPWTPPVGFASVPQLNNIKKEVDIWDSTTEEGSKDYQAYLVKLKKWIVKAEKALAAKKRVSALPEKTGANTNHQAPTKLYNAMINPMVPYAIRGAIWYQGESNGGEGESYFQKMKALITGWRKVWNQGDFPFYYVQLANFRVSNPNNPAGGDGWANLREAQVKSLTIPKTGMATIIDIGEANDIHPKNKQDVGKRLALWALANDYGKKIVYSGPLYKNQKIEGDKIRISFDHVGSGLMVGRKKGLEPVEEVSDEKLKWFAIKGKDGKWHWADAVIDGETVVVSSDKVKNPVAVRYAFTMNPVGANLYNKDGLPASPFKTDK